MDLFSPVKLEAFKRKMRENEGKVTEVEKVEEKNRGNKKAKKIGQKKVKRKRLVGGKCFHFSSVSTLSLHPSFWNTFTVI